MTSFKDRERGEEAKYAFDEETSFKIAARRNRLLVWDWLWMALAKPRGRSKRN